MNFFQPRSLSEAASELMQFDADSIRQVVSSLHRDVPDIWLVDPDAYEKNGRVLRDSDSPRMLAYSTKEQILYATDGCNSCTRRLTARLDALPSDDLKKFAEENEIRAELIQRLAELVRRHDEV
jgi:hypothetical protein